MDSVANSRVQCEVVGACRLIRGRWNWEERRQRRRLAEAKQQDLWRLLEDEWKKHPADLEDTHVSYLRRIAPTASRAENRRSSATSTRLGTGQDIPIRPFQQSRVSSSPFGQSRGTRRPGDALMKNKPNCDRRQVVLLRHGESVWNKDNLFTGWTDVDLSDRGREQGQEAGRGLKVQGVCVRCRFHFRVEACDTDLVARARRDRSDVDRRSLRHPVGVPDAKRTAFERRRDSLARRMTLKAVAINKHRLRNNHT